ncbi:MAG: DinB family protein [Acidobacteria bacterium]|nr:DinB family protein [Acidobacteriota bacterium]
MSELEFITDQLKRAFDGGAWHGPALMELLDGIDARAAAARPIASGHNIWELALHIAGWERVVTRRLQGQAFTLSDDENFGHTGPETEPAWREAIRTVGSNHTGLVRVVQGLSDARLNDPVPGKDYNVRFMLIGSAQHAAYHGGQIALLKRARA